jgi:hypothetical protein
MVVGQDLGITLDMENWWIRAGAKGIVQSTDLVPMGMEGHTLQLLHHPTGAMQQRTPDWIVLAVPAQPVEWLYFDLKQRVHRGAGGRLRRSPPSPRRRRGRRTRRRHLLTRRCNDWCQTPIVTSRGSCRRWIGPAWRNAGSGSPHATCNTR